MEPAETSGRLCFNGEFRHGVDDKRRLAVPARWRPKAGVELTLVLWPKDKAGPCLRLLLPQKMADMMRDIDAMPNENPGKVALKRFIGRQSSQVTLDSAGRICLPDEMAKAAGIKDQAVLVGLLDRIEIWSPERFQNVTAADEIIAQDAFKLME